MAKLPLCRWRGPLRHERHACGSNRLIGTALGVTPEQCALCPYADAPLIEEQPPTHVGPCIHLGTLTGKTVECPTCGGRVRLKVFSCAVHGECVLERGQTALPSCRTCPDRQSRLIPGLNLRAEPVWTLGDVPELLPGLDDPLPLLHDPERGKTWAQDPRVIAYHVEAWRELLAATIAPPAEAEGDGIVYCGGGRYWPMVSVAIRMARKFSSKPIQVWHRGDKEEPIDRRDVDDLAGITFHDATRYRTRILGGWEIKALALLHCGFRRVLYLDADAYLVGPADALFDLVGQGVTLAYWTDFPDHEFTVTWRAFGASPASSIDPVQGGQIVFDRVAGWRSLVLAHWLNQHSDYSYNHAYGDQDQWRVSWSATRAPVHCLGPAPYLAPAFVVSVIPGTPVICHRVRAKLWPHVEAIGSSDMPGDSDLAVLWARQRHRTGQAARVFGEVYRSGLWAAGERSGRGSGERERAPYLHAVNELLRRRGWRSVVDLGSGDGEITRRLRAAEVVGVECHRPHVERLRRERPSIRWECLDLDGDREQLPAGEVALLKDVLHHWPSSLVLDWLTWAQRCQRWRWLVLTNDRHQDQGPGDCDLGGYRALDPQYPPLAAIAGLTLVRRYLHKAIYLLDLSIK